MTAARSTRVRIARRCYIDARERDDLVLRCLAVLESSPPDTLIASVTAARLHGLWLPAIDDVIHVATATPGRAGSRMTRTRRPEFVAHRYQLRPEDRDMVMGVGITSVARTWAHLAQVLNFPDLVAAGDSALRSGAAKLDLAGAAQRSRHCLGAGSLTHALTMLDRRSRSRPESHLRVAISAPDLPRFEVNQPVYRAEGGWLAEPDLSLVEARLALEYQGEDHAGVTRMRKDISRKIDLRDNTWAVFEYGPAQVFGRPAQIRAEVRRYLRERAPHLLASSRQWSVGRPGGQL